MLGSIFTLRDKYVKKIYSPFVTSMSGSLPPFRDMCVCICLFGLVVTSISMAMFSISKASSAMFSFLFIIHFLFPHPPTRTVQHICHVRTEIEFLLRSKKDVPKSDSISAPTRVCIDRQEKKKKGNTLHLMANCFLCVVDHRYRVESC